MNDMLIDTNVGIFYSELIMFFIIVASAATIYKAGAKNVSQLDLAAIAGIFVLSQAIRHISCSPSASWE